MRRRDFVQAGLFGGIMIFSPQFGRFFREQPKLILPRVHYKTMGFSISQELLDDDIYQIVAGNMKTKVTGYNYETRMYEVEILKPKRFPSTTTTRFTTNPETWPDRYNAALIRRPKGLL